MNDKRRRRAVWLISLGLLVLICGLLYRAWLHRPAVFKASADVSVLDDDTIEVKGVRVPDGPGVWRYHINSWRWDRAAAWHPATTEDSQEDSDPPQKIDQDWMLAFNAAEETAAEDGARPDYATMRFSRIRQSDGKRLALGTVRHVPIAP